MNQKKLWFCNKGLFLAGIVPFLFALGVVGLSGIVAQVLILRELLPNFYGNELALCIVLANWILSEAAGVLIAARHIDRFKETKNILVVFNLIFLSSFPLALYASRVCKYFLSIPFGESLGIEQIILVSLFIVFCPAFCHGALFSGYAKICASEKQASNPVSGALYAWETIGTLIGSLVLTFFFIPYLNSFQTAFLIAIANIALCVMFFKRLSRGIKFCLVILCIFTLYLILTDGVKNLELSSLKRQWKPQDVVAYRNSAYGTTVVVKREGQQTFYHNGLPVITAPYPDISLVEEFAHLAMLFHRAPEKLLVIGGGSGGLLRELLKYPLKKIDYVELDPVLFQMLARYPTGLTASELSDPRVSTLMTDSTFFLKTTRNTYDLIIVGTSSPSDLVSNRTFTREFFSLTACHLHPNGILAFRLPGSLVFMGPELKRLNASILDGLKKSFPSIKVIPGDLNIFLASVSRDVLSTPSAVLFDRMQKRNITTRILSPAYLEYKLAPAAGTFFAKSLEGIHVPINEDIRPYAVFQTLLSWMRQFSPRTTAMLRLLEGINLKILSLVLVILALGVYSWAKINGGLLRWSLIYAIATTGFFGMTISMVLNFSFQIFYGYLYKDIGILIAAFMSGVALGSLLAVRKFRKTLPAASDFMVIEVAIIIFTYCLGWLLLSLHTLPLANPFFFSVFYIFAGVLMGWEFPIASFMLTGNRISNVQGVGLLYGVDLLGGWLGGIIGGVFFLPILGLFDTCLVVTLVKISSLILFISAQRK